MCRITFNMMHADFIARNDLSVNFITTIKVTKCPPDSTSKNRNLKPNLKFETDTSGNHNVKKRWFTVAHNVAFTITEYTSNYLVFFSVALFSTSVLKPLSCCEWQTSHVQ